MKLVDGKEWRPIAFVDELVQAILRGEKTETRRIVQGVPYWDHLHKPIMNWGLSACYVDDDDGRAWLDVQTEVDDNSHRELRCPYGKPGGRLWVRERFACFKDDARPCSIADAEQVVFRDGFRKHGGRNLTVDQWNDPESVAARCKWLEDERPLWRPPMHLPFWAFRIGLEVVSISIERVQEITEAGAVAEGFQPIEIPKTNIGPRIEPAREVSARDKFRAKWDLINGKRKDKETGRPFVWELNPFVWVVKFRKLDSVE